MERLCLPALAGTIWTRESLVFAGASMGGVRIDRYGLSFSMTFLFNLSGGSVVGAIATHAFLQHRFAVAWRPAG
jgi:hypothetical protein